MATATKLRVDAALANKDEALRVAELLRDFFRYMALDFGYILVDPPGCGEFSPDYTPAGFAGRPRCNREVVAMFVADYLLHAHPQDPIYTYMHTYIYNMHTCIYA